MKLPIVKLHIIAVKLHTTIVKLLCRAPKLLCLSGTKVVLRVLKLCHQVRKLLLRESHKVLGGGIGRLCSSFFSEMDCLLGRKDERENKDIEKEKNISSNHVNDLSAL
jgi:hypothetical protein